MPAVGGGGRGNSGRRKVVRKPKPKPPPRPAASFVPGVGAVAKPSRPARAPKPTPKQVQRATRGARPLAARPVKPKVVVVAKPAKPSGRKAANLVPVVGEAKRGATKPLQAKPPRNIRAGKPVRTAKQRRAVAVAAYDELNRGEKKAVVNAAHNRAVKGKATESDKAVLHAHRTRVAGTKKVARAVRSFDALTEPKRGLHLDPRVTLATEPKPFRKYAGSVATLPSVGKVVAAIGPASTKGLKSAGVPKVVANIPRDVAELAVTSPTALAKFAVTAAKKPKEAGKMVVQPYKDLWKDPKKFVTEHPVTSALMVAPGPRVVDRAAGRALRKAGVQSLNRPSATLPGTALRETRTGARGVVTRTVQAARDKKRGAQTMTQAHVQRRVDEFYDAGKQHVTRVEAAAAREAKKTAQKKGLDKTERKALVAERVEGAKADAHANQVPRQFAREFGSPLVRRDDKIIEPTHATGGAIHGTAADAQAIADHLNARQIKIKRGAHGPHQAARRNAETPVEFVVRDAGDGRFAVVPKVAAERLHKQKVVGTSEAPGAKYMRTAGRSFRGAVLPLSARWLVGQVGESAFRSAVAGAGPADMVRVKRVVRKMNAQEKGSGDKFLQRIHGGQFDLTGTAREFAEGRTLAEEFKGTALEDVAHGATRVGATRPARAIRKGWGQYSRVVFDVVNGAIERTARQAMAGQAIRQGALMEKRVLGLTDKAIDEAARGLKGTDAQVQVARAVDRMYGQYQKFSPEKREHLLHTTPFYPWYRNMVTFLLQTLPVDHPVKAALVADLDAATEEWRKATGLTTKGGKPGFLKGTYPVGDKGQVVPVGRYLPFAPGEPLEAVGDLFLPQYANVQEILKGVDWKGEEIKPGKVPGELTKSVIEAHVPGAGQVGRITGLSARYLQGKKGEATIFTGKDVKEALVHEVSPLPRTKAREAEQKKGVVKVTPVKVKRVKVKPVRVGGS